MSRDDLSILMWSEACRLLDRAESLHRQFFRIGSEAAGISWEPPADVYETERELLIEIALPGVDAAGVEIAFASGVLVVSGERRLPAIPDPAVIRRMELPHGRFERRIRLEAGRYELTKRTLADGCLRLVLLKLD
jgi:HSP20 family protein